MYRGGIGQTEDPEREGTSHLDLCIWAPIRDRGVYDARMGQVGVKNEEDKVLQFVVV